MKKILLLLSLIISLPSFSADILDVEAGDVISEAKMNEIIGKVNHESQKLRLKYTSNSGQNLPRAANTNLIFGNMQFDTSSGTTYNSTTGVFSPSRDGFYQVCVNIEIATETNDFGTVFQLNSVKSGTVSINEKLDRHVVYTQIVDSVNLNGCHTYSMTASDTITINLYHNDVVTPETNHRTLLANDGYNSITIIEQ